MNDYRAVSDALAKGASPAALCATCPWDRYCINPPSMTRDDVDKRMKEAQAKDEVKAAAGNDKSGGVPINTILNIVTFASKDMEAMVCPVFALRLRSSDGRAIVDTMKASMKAWDDNPASQP